MNKIFKVIFNKTTQQLQVVSELAKSQCKTTVSVDRRKSVASLIKFKISLLALSLSMSPLSMAAGTYNKAYGGSYAYVYGVDNKWGDRLNGDYTKPIIVGVSNFANVPVNAASVPILR